MPKYTVGTILGLPPMRRRQPQTSNLVNKLTQVSMPRAGYTQTRSFVYNNDQRLASATNPENGTVNYNGDGTQARKTHPKGQWIGYGYDANGNVTATPDLGLSYDVENRLVGANQEHYGYGPGNQRVWKQWPDGHEEVYFWGPDGRKLGSYRPTESWTGNEQDPHIFVFQTTQNYLYFARQLVGESTAPQCTEREEGQCVYWMMPSVSGIALDRLGSVRARTRPWMQPPNNLLRSSYYPYGEERQTTEQDRDKFATYHRDSTTGLDYANQRYYSSLTGRFLTPDPYQPSGRPAHPQSWNRYAYVENDPITYIDPAGLYKRCPFGTTSGGTYCVIIDELGADWEPTRYYYGPEPVFGGSGRGGGADGGTGSARAKYKIEVENLSKSGPQENAILEMLRSILANIDEDCARWLNGYEAYVRGLLGENTPSAYIAHGVFRNQTTIAAFTGGGPSDTNVPSDYAATVINDVGAFFMSTAGENTLLVANGRYTGGTPVAQAFILLHEIAHGLGLLEPDFGDQAAVNRNGSLVLEHCQRTLGRFQ